MNQGHKSPLGGAHPWQHFFQAPMVLQTIYCLQGKLVYKTPPLTSLTTMVQIQHQEPLQGLTRLARASHGLTCKVCMLSTTTTHEPQLHVSFPPLPDVHVYTHSDTVTPSCPCPPDMHGHLVLDAHDRSCPHLTASPDAHAHSPPLSFPRSLCTTAQTSMRLPAFMLTIGSTSALPSPSCLPSSRPLPHIPNSNVTTTT